MDNVLSIYALSEELRRLMVEEILGAFNRFVTIERLSRELGHELGREPTNDECAYHYLTHGGLDNFRKVHNVPIAC